MRVTGAIAAALQPFLRRPVRTLLLLQGTIWGVAVAVFPSAVIEGTRQAAIQRGTRLGADRVAVAPDPTATDAPLFTRDDVAHVREALTQRGVRVVSAGGVRVLETRGPVGSLGAFVEAEPEAPAARGLVLASGRWLRADDGPNTCVVEAGVGARVGEERSFEVAPGRSRVCRVVGVTARQDALKLRTNDLGFDVAHPMYAKVAQSLLQAFGVPYVEDGWKRSDAVVWAGVSGQEVDWIFLRVDPRDVKAAADIAGDVLVERGRSPVTLHPLVLPFLMGEEIERFDAVRAALFLACLVMGAVVMANLGLLAVLRRRHEIAVRRVEGATRRRIALHFLLEGLALAVVGAVAGCGLGMALAALRVALSPVAGFTFVFPWRDGLLAVVVALVVGTLAALLPALRASRLDPIAGLAEE